jgi:predicted nicotinamide N-methyase
MDDSAYKPDAQARDTTSTGEMGSSLACASGLCLRSLANRNIPGGWSEQDIAVGNRTFRMLLPADPVRFLDELDDSPAAPRELSDPYWAKLWPAAYHLAEAMLAADFPPGAEILEIGCGSGLAGLAALARGYRVTFSDYVPMAVELALENAARNNLASRAHGLVLDWRDPPALKQPVIIAADVLYEQVNNPTLVSLLEKILAEGGVAWFGDAGRSASGDFLKLATDRGFSVKLLDEHNRPVGVPAVGRYQRFVVRRSQRAGGD